MNNPKKSHKKIMYPRVKEAREALANKAKELFELQITIIKGAIAKEDYETASKANQWLIGHVPADKDGLRMVEVDVDKPKESKGSGGIPSIQIGFKLGGVPDQLALPPANAEVIDIAPEDDEDN